MKGATLEISADGATLSLVLMPEEFELQNTEKSLLQFIEYSEHHALYVHEEKLTELLGLCNAARLAKQTEPVTLSVAEKRDFVCVVSITEEGMSAEAEITAPFGGKLPTVADITRHLQQQGVKRGISTKQINYLVKKVKALAPGELINHTIARGLPVKHGRDSYLKPLVPNALDRILRPKVTDDDIADMRDLGDIITVKQGTPILERVAPTEGRPGYDIFNTALLPTPGKLYDLKPGVGTEISAENPNVLIASLTGMPKFKNNSMWVDDVFICKGVNVSTGNIRYDGSVIVNGDVAEKMKVICSGDVTINGFVESAHIEAGGDIIITQGALGKVDDKQTEYSTTLDADGSIHLEHGQGLRIRAKGNVTVGKQLAYSDIVTGGSITVGQIDKPNGNLFACKIICEQSVKAGTLGAVSGSQLSIDFSGGYNQIIDFQSNIDNLFTSLGKTLADHMNTINAISAKRVPSEIQPKADLALEIYESERRLYAFLRQKLDDVKSKRAEFISDIGLEANKVLYPGVTVKLNNRSWRSEKEYSRARIHYTDYKWQFDPLT